MSFTEFLDMGGYARFVWPSYALVIAGIVLNIFWARAKLKRARLEARRRLVASDMNNSATQTSATSGSPIEGHSS